MAQFSDELMRQLLGFMPVPRNASALEETVAEESLMSAVLRSIQFQRHRPTMIGRSVGESVIRRLEPRALYGPVAQQDAVAAQVDAAPVNRGEQQAQPVIIENPFVGGNAEPTRLQKIALEIVEQAQNASPEAQAALARTLYVLDQGVPTPSDRTSRRRS